MMAGTAWYGSAKLVMFKKIRRLISYVFVKSLMLLAQAMPRKAGLALFGSLGALAYYLLPRSRGVAWSNLRLVFEDGLSEAELKRIARASFVSMGRFAFDVARLPVETGESIARIVRVTGEVHLERALSKGNGVIALTGHIGNWEMMGAYFALRGYPINVVATTLRDNKLNDIINQIREGSGMKVLERRKGTMGAMRSLKRGEVLGVLIDQDTSVQSVEVDFLGVRAKTAVGPVRLSAKTGAAILPAAMLMTDDGKYHVEIREPLCVVGEPRAVLEDVSACSRAVEEFILKQPEQWVWMHKRWKSVRPDMYR
jgi:KDO2-lipid IV(A) lauroyltransferase